MVIPNHLGIIIDGPIGEVEGLQSAWRVAKTAGRAGVRHLSFFNSEDGHLGLTPVVRQIVGRFAALVKLKTGMTVRLVTETRSRDDRPRPTGGPDLDLLVRTGGRRLLGNFFLGHFTPTDLVFSPKGWADFGEQDILAAFRHYAQVRRWPQLPGVRFPEPAEISIN